jgi:hypothetical protein
MTEQEKLIHELAAALSLALREMSQHIPDDCDCPKVKEAWVRGRDAVMKAKEMIGPAGVKWTYR